MKAAYKTEFSQSISSVGSSTETIFVRLIPSISRNDLDWLPSNALTCAGLKRSHPGTVRHRILSTPDGPLPKQDKHPLTTKSMPLSSPDAEFTSRAKHQHRLHKIKRRLRLGQHAKFFLPPRTLLSDSGQSYERRTAHQRLQNVVEPDMGYASLISTELAQLYNARPVSHCASRCNDLHATTLKGIRAGLDDSGITTTRVC
jgi:hypothetical protein